MKTKITGLTFSWKRALGITKIKQKIAKETGIPTSKQGLERKIGKTLLDMFLKNRTLNRKKRLSKIINKHLCLKTF